MTYGPTLAAHSIEHAVGAGIDPGEVEDVIRRRGARGHHRRQRGAAGRAARRAARSPPAGSINRFCSSGLQAIAMAAHRVIVDGRR